MFITDEVNTSYNAYQLEALETLKQNDIDVIVTNLDQLGIQTRSIQVCTGPSSNGSAKAEKVGL